MLLSVHALPLSVKTERVFDMDKQLIDNIRQLPPEKQDQLIAVLKRLLSVPEPAIVFQDSTDCTDQ